ncbi:MAG TPA: alpha/beta hydrolase [Chitinophagaceae bacterium]|nr:alpha/beta hydrolase [Chitinophagaceae bacterium]
MNRKIFRRLLFGFLILIAVWLVFAQCSMKFRMRDSEAKEKFSKNNVALKTGTIEVDGFGMHYAKTGDDTLPTLFFVHGSPGGWTAFEKYMQDKDLLGKYRMISIDRPGFGYSHFGDAKNLDDQSKLISPVVKSFQNGKAMYAVGHSLGGPMIVKLQMDNENLFTGLVLLAGSVDPNEEKPERWRFMVKDSPLQYFLPGAFRPSNEELVYLKSDLKETDKEWDKITCAVWIIHGDKDTFVPVGNADYAKKKLTKAKSVEVKILPGARHFIPWEQYEDIKEVLMRLPI